MKRMHGILVAALALAALLPAALPAQEVYTIRPRGMLGIGYDAVGGFNSRAHVVREVVKDSPAEKAGLMAGDTIIRVNGLAASAQIMGAPFEPGDTVVLRVKRNGRERDVTVVAAARPGATSSTFSYVLPDTVMGRISIIMDAMRAHVDTAHMPMIRLREGDSTWVFRGGADSVFMRRFGDGVNGVFHFRNGDSTRVFQFGGDSVRAFFHRDSIGVFEFDHEFSGLIELDSLRTRVLRYVEGMPAIIADSMFMSRDGNRVFSYGSAGDTLVFARPGEIFAGGMTIGMRAVAGAELSELNEGLSEYFGATDGVLVLNARDGTPAARAGLRAGDVILRANGSAVTSIIDLRRAIAGREGGSVRLEVQRRGERVTVTLDRE